MKAKHLAIFATFLAAPLITQPAFATPITYSESVSLSSSTPGQPTFSNIKNFSGKRLNNPVTKSPFFKGTPAGSGSGTETSTITATFSFTDSAGGSGSASDTGIFYADYTNLTDWVIWSGETGGTGLEQIGGVATFDAILSDNAMIQIQLEDANDWYIKPGVTFTLLDGPSTTPVPEPGSLALFGTALLGFGVVLRRRWRV